MSDAPRTEVQQVASGVVHVWTLELAPRGLEAVPAHLSHIASASGRTARRIVARRRAREILAGYLGVSPIRVTIGRTENGKPLLRNSLEEELSFSLSHSGTWALLAIARRPVGVDVERLRSIPDAIALARRFFTSAEAARLEGLGSQDLREAFLRTWVRKEAYLKGLGGTVPADLRRFELGESSAGLPRIAWTQLERRGPSLWSLSDLEAPAGYIASVAVEGKIERIEHLPH